MKITEYILIAVLAVLVAVVFAICVKQRRELNALQEAVQKSQELILTSLNGSMKLVDQNFATVRKFATDCEEHFKLFNDRVSALETAVQDTERGDVHGEQGD